MTPRVSVVMPVRNGARWVDEAVSSVLAQTLSDFELLVIDDGSTDGTPALLRAAAASDERVNIVRQEPLGLIAALNAGLQRARAPLVARLDADDRAMPTRLERQTGYLQEHPEIGLLGSWAQRIDPRGRATKVLRPETRPDVLAAILPAGNPFVHTSVMFRTDLARRVGGYRDAFEAAEDYDLWLRMAEAARVAILPEILVAYRVHGASVSSRHTLQQSFSTRLAKRAAKLRRESGQDPAGHLASRPDWHSPQAGESFYADDARIYRLLDDANASARDGRGVVEFSPLLAAGARLNKVECRLAAQAMLAHMKHAPWPLALRTVWPLSRILLRQPGIGLDLARSRRRREQV